MKRPITVLHVDDEPEILSLLADSIAREGSSTQTLTAANADVALELLESSDVDCVVTDTVALSTGEPFPVAARRVAPDVPMVVFTGKEWGAVSGVARDADVETYIRKGGAKEFGAVAKEVLTLADGQCETHPVVDPATVGSTATPDAPGTAGAAEGPEGGRALTLEGGWTVVDTYDFATPDEVGFAVIGALEAYTGRDSLRIDPLYEVIDPEALGSLLAGKRHADHDPVEVRFPAEDLEVAVTSEGVVAVRDPRALL